MVGEILGLDPNTGAKRWTIPVDGSPSAPILGPGDALYVLAVGVSGHPSHLYKIDYQLHKVVWKTTIAGNFMGITASQPSLGINGSIYVIDPRDPDAGTKAVSKLYSFASETGAMQWERKIDGLLSPRMAVSDADQIYLSGSQGPLSNNGFVSCISSSDGHEIWKINLNGDASMSVPVIGDNGMVYIAAGNPLSSIEIGKLYAIDTATHAIKWFKRTTETRVAIGPKGTIYSDITGSGLWALDPETGRVEWTAKVDHGIDCSPVVGSDGTVYAPFGSNFFALSGTTGHILWRMPIKFVSTGAIHLGFMDSLAISRAGVVYYSALFNGLYAIE